MIFGIITGSILVVLDFVSFLESSCSSSCSYSTLESTKSSIYSMSFLLEDSNLLLLS
jgi:hypothetical protein